MERILSRSPSQHSATASENSHRLAPDPTGLWSLKTTRFFRCEKIYKTLPMSECSYKTNRTCSTIITQDYWVHTIQFSKRTLISFSSSYIFCQWSIGYHQWRISAVEAGTTNAKSYSVQGSLAGWVFSDNPITLKWKWAKKLVTNLLHSIYSVFSLSSWLPSSVDTPSCKNMHGHHNSKESQGKSFVWAGYICWTCFLNLGEQKKWVQSSVRS